MKSITLKVCFPEKRQLNSFVNMLAWMELCGNVGHCTDFVVNMDGDGSARPKFIFESEELQKSFNELRRSYEKNELRTIPNVRGLDYKYTDMRFNIS